MSVGEYGCRQQRAPDAAPEGGHRLPVRRAKSSKNLSYGEPCSCLIRGRSVEPEATVQLVHEMRSRLQRASECSYENCGYRPSRIRDRPG